MDNGRRWEPVDEEAKFSDSRDSGLAAILNGSSGGNWCCCPVPPLPSEISKRLEETKGANKTVWALIIAWENFILIVRTFLY